MLFVAIAIFDSRGNKAELLLSAADIHSHNPELCSCALMDGGQICVMEAFKQIDKSNSRFQVPSPSPKSLGVKLQGDRKD